MISIYIYIYIYIYISPPTRATTRLQIVIQASLSVPDRTPAREGSYHVLVHRSWNALRTVVGSFTFFTTALPKSAQRRGCK